MKKCSLRVVSLIFFILGISLFICTRQIHTYDYWWHIKAGEYIVNQGIPYIDVFSWYGISNNIEWFSHEWLSEVILYMFSKIKIGGYLYCIIYTITILFLLFLFNKKQYIEKYHYSVIWVIVGGFICFSIVVPRPHMISFILFEVLLYVLFKFKENENCKLIWLVPILSFIWANIHGGSSNLPYILCMIMLIVGLKEFSILKIYNKGLTSLQIKTLLKVILLSLAVMCINPHGINILSYPYINMNNSYMLSIIYEWKCPDLKSISDLPIFINIFIIVCTLFFTKKEIDFYDFSLIGAFIYLSLKSIRFSILLYIVASFIIFKYIDKRVYNKKLENISYKIILCLGSLFILFYIICIPTIIPEPLVRCVSDSIIETVKDEQPKRLYNDYDIGGYLIYKDIKVFVDGRADMYSDYNLRDAVNLEQLKDSPKKIINKYNFDLYITNTKCALYYYLWENSDYVLLNEDEDYAVFKSMQ